MLHIPFKRLALGLVVGVPAIVVFGAASCDDVNLPTVDAQLVSPPAVPAPISRGRAHVVADLHVQEKVQEIAPGVQYTTWTFNGSDPGPMIRVRQGDEVEVRLTNPAESVATHNIDLHAVNGPGGGAGATNVAPGESKAFTFLAKAPGLYVYHCAAGIVADHIANGMYGAILVEPADGRLGHVDKEFYIGQQEFYTTGDTNVKGKQDLDLEKLLAENPPYVTFNGNTKSTVGDNALKARVGDRVRIYLANGGPNLTSSFHVIGEIFDKAYVWGSLDVSVPNVQTVSVPPGGAVVTEFRLDVPGDYKLVDHALGRVAKGAVGTLTAAGAEDLNVFNAHGAGPEAASHQMAAATPTTAAPSASAAAGTTVQPNSDGSLTITMKDNVFDPKQVTVQAGKKVTINLPNAGAVPHNLHVADATGNYDSKASVVSDPEIINAKKSGTFAWTPDKAGTYKFRCDIHPDQMTGTFVVQ